MDSGSTFYRMANAWFNFTCYHPPLATHGTSPALRARGWGIVRSSLVPGVGRQGKSKITFCCSCEVRHFSVDTTALDRVKTAYFQGISRICRRLVREELPLKNKICIRRYVYYKLLNECAFDAHTNGWRSSQTEIFLQRIYT